MINVSNSFKEELNNDNRDYMCYVDIVLVNPGDIVESYLQDSSGEYILDSSGENINTFFDGVAISLTNENLWSSALSIEESVSNQNSFDVGSVIINKATIVINNIYEDYTSYDFTGAKVTIRIGLQLSNGTIEVVNKGIFYVDSATYNGSLITLECLDSMSKFDKDYSESTLTYPATLRQIVQNACSVCDVLYSAATFENDTFIVNERPSDESLTFRQMLNYVGQIACQQFSIDHNDRLIARWYDRDMMDDLYSSPSSVDDSEYHQISSINSQNINQDDVIITGVKVTEFSESTENPGGSYLSGTTGYVIEIKDNKLIPIGKGSGVSTYLGQKLVGMRFRPMELTFQNDPTIEPTDIAEVIDFKGNHFYTFITSTNFTVGNTQTLSCGAESPIRNSASRYSAATQAYTNSKKLVEKEKTERELAVEALNNALSNASGMYTTEKRQSDGSVITYLHDKPTLEESQNVIMITAEAIGISNDGGETYPYGLFLTGDLIARLLYVVGINADYINSGAITVADNDGEITFFADTETGRVDIKAYSLTITGKTVEEIANEESETVLNDFVDSVYTPTITNLQNQIDGQIETWFYNYIPTAENYPASEWTTDTEKDKHLGDLFYVVDNAEHGGQAYRWAKIGTDYLWDYVEDTAVVKALADAATAKDIADGKRRVFVVTPQPPYDIGDLWCNGEDILTCSTARPQGSLYVSSDWEKLNSYTDDTVANEALEEARQARNLNIILDNEYQGIPADYEGNIDTFPEVKTFVQVLYGHTDVSTDCIYAITKSNSVTGSWDNAARTYTVTGLSEDTGWVDITASYLSIFTTTKRFNVQKVKDGPPGAAGAPGRTYTIEPSVNVLKRASDNSIAPNFIEFNAYYRDGNSVTRTAYAGRWIIEETADGDEWTTIYTSSANENSVTHYLYSMLADSDGSAIANANGDTIGIPRDIVAIRAKLYAAGGTTNLLDMQSVAVVIDVDNLTHEEIFNLLTNNGAIQGIYMENGQLYINGTYISIDDLVSLNAEIGGWDINNEGIYKKFKVYNDNYMVFLRKPSEISYSKEDVIGIYHISEEGDIISKIFNIDSLGGYSNYHFGELGLSDSSLVIDGGDITFYNTNGDSVGYINVQPGYLKIGGENDGAYLNFTAQKDESINTARITTDSVISTVTYMNATAMNADIMNCNVINVNQTKSRVVSTKDYGTVRQYSYETASPYFGDIGQGCINDEGECCIFIDDIFSETVISGCEYQVFLQKEGKGDLWVSKKEQNYFIVTGTPNLRFAWEIKAVQINNETERLENFDIFEENIHMDENKMECVINEEIDEFFSF